MIKTLATLLAVTLATSAAAHDYRGHYSRHGLMKRGIVTPPITKDRHCSWSVSGPIGVMCKPGMWDHKKYPRRAGRFIDCRDSFDMLSMARVEFCRFDYRNAGPKRK